MNNLPADDSHVSGQAARIPAKPVTLDEGAAMLKSQGGTLRAEVQIIRKATGKVENYTLLMGDEAKEL
jgi:hypothetical protein